MQHTPLLMRQLVERGALVAPDEEIVTATESGTRRQTYRQTRERAHQLAHALAGAGIKVGDRVATFMWNGSRHLEAYHAISCMGAVLHPLNVRFSAEATEYIVNHAEDKLLIIDADLLPAFEKLAGKVPTIKQVVVATEAGLEGWKTSLPAAVDYEAFIDGQPTEYQWPDLDENAPLGMCYTSGTTGNPKGVMYEHRSQYLNTITLAMTDAMNMSATDSICGVVPMYHAMGWGIPWAATMLGAKQVFPYRFMKPDQLSALFAAEQVSLATGVPTIWEEMKARIEADRGQYDLSRLSRLVCGGSAPPAALSKWYFEELEVELIQGFGMTETSALVTISRRLMKHADLKCDEDQQLANIAKTGIAMPGLDVEIVDDDFNPLPHDGQHNGEFLIRGAWICDDYYNESHPDAFHNDWLRTGDIAAIDSGEYVIVTDRAKDLIKSGGEWISSEDLENDIVAVEGVVEACVVAQPHPKWDERPVALVVLKAGAGVTAQQIREHLAKNFARWQLPDDIIFVDSIPLTGTGKMDKKAVRANLKAEGYLLPDLRK
jgi:acyl-CoA synthetase (AMP-forming)/AMP-acid ligase II